MTAINNTKGQQDTSVSIADTNQTLNGYMYPNTPFTPYQPNGPYRTVAVAQTRAHPTPFLLYHSSVNVLERLDEKLGRIMQEVNEKLSRLDILEEISNRIVNKEKLCQAFDAEMLDVLSNS